MELVKVYSAGNELDAELIKSVLESEGIPSMSRFESYGRFLPGLMGSASTLGGVEILVRPEHVEQARQILSEVRIEADLPEGGYPEGEEYEDEER